MKNFLKKHFSKNVNQCSPVQKDYVREVLVDEAGTEKVVFKEVDYRKLQRSVGKISDWSLNSLLKAGVNPDFPIHTGNPTRLEGISSVADFAARADELLGSEVEDLPEVNDTENNK